MHLPAVSGPSLPPLVQPLAIGVLVLPWLWPFAMGPTPSVLPQLASFACAAVFLLVYLARPADPGTLLARSLLIAALVSSVIGLLQYLGVSGSFAPWVNVTLPGYAYGNLRQRNQLSSLLNIGLAALVWGAWTDHRRDTRNIDQPVGQTMGLRHSSLRLLAVVLLASANAATSSRTGLVQMATLLVLAMVWRRPAAPGTKRMLVGAVLIYALASVLLPVLAGLDPFVSGIAGRFSDAGQACQSRLILWRNVLELIAQKPWFGWGWGELDYAHFITLYPGARFCDILDNAHNLPLHLAVELGVPVALFACGLIGWLVLRARPWRELDDQRRLAWAVLALIGLHSLLEYPLWYGPFQIAAALAVWVLWRVPHTVDAPCTQGAGVVTDARPARQPALGRTASARWVGSLAALVLLAVAYAAWDYQRVSQIYRAPAQRKPAYRDDTLAKIGDSWLFRNQVRFAALTLTRVTQGNAAAMHREAQVLLHFSPEARVVEKSIDSALLLGRLEEAASNMRRFQAAYPADYAHWRTTRESAAELPSID